MRSLLLVAFLCTLTPALSPADPTEPELMGQAQRAYLAGNMDAAIPLFAQVLQMDPHNALALQYLRKIRAALVAGQPTMDPIKDLVIPKIDIKNAPFTAALDFLKQEAAKQSVSVSFVAQLPVSQMQHPVTLSLSQIPFLDALRYLCALDNSTYRVDQYAIVILPASAADSAAIPAQ